MHKILRNFAVLAALVIADVVFAYHIVDVTNDRKDVFCNDPDDASKKGQFVGSMFWNGSKWSDGLRADENPDVVAKQMVAAQGSNCQ